MRAVRKDYVAEIEIIVADAGAREAIPLYEAFAVRNLPTLVFIDSAGQVDLHHLGTMNEQAIRSRLDSLR